MENYYLCDKCFGITKRSSKAKSIKSDCTEANEKATLTKINSADDLAIELRKEYLSNMFDLDSFKPKQVLFLEQAFEQGAKIVFNRLKL